jgi:hypothetical protein
MTTNNAALRVQSIDASLVRTINLPAHLQVHIPALDETRAYDLTSVTDEQLIDMLQHGASQKLTDAAAGKKDEKAIEAVDKREKTLWMLTGLRGSLLDPVTREMYDLNEGLLTAAKVPTKQWPKVRDFTAYLETRTAEWVANLRRVAEANVQKRAETLALLAAFDPTETQE